MVVAPPAFTWTGFYIGVNAGGAFQQNTNGNNADPSGNFLLPGNAVLLGEIAFPVNANTGNSSNGGFTGGGTIGYNWQGGMFVVGVEGDANYLDTGDHNHNASIPGVLFVPFAVGGPTTVSYLNNSDNDHFFATARARFGIAYDRSLFYVTGGAAFRSSRRDEVVNFTNAAGLTYASFTRQGGSDSNVGYVGGGGVEYAFTDNLTGKLEGLYAAFNKHDRVLTAPALATTAGYSFTEHSNRNLTIVRVGLNYKFGFGSPVVVAKY